MVNAPTPFHHPLVEQPRLTELALAPDGTRLVAAVQTLDDEGTRYVSELWEVDPAGEREARLVSGSVPGDFAPVFTADGSLLFFSERGPHEPPGAALWALSEHGEAERIAHHPGGMTALTAASHASTLARTAALLRTFSLNCTNL
ncbi:hypothetical protein [Streptomyces canus]|uniref:hypothetical protein n=1 Tax=Streptomyces canus TaxID=58343 RepID=UPI0033B2DEA2